METHVGSPNNVQFGAMINKGVGMMLAWNDVSFFSTVDIYTPIKIF